MHVSFMALSENPSIIISKHLGVYFNTTPSKIPLQLQLRPQNYLQHTVDYRFYFPFCVFSRQTGIENRNRGHLIPLKQTLSQFAITLTLALL